MFGCLLNTCARSINKATIHLTQLFNKNLITSTIKHTNWQIGTSRYFSTTQWRTDLMEFFDEKKNWMEPKVKHGRPWRIDELRLKSNVDLHKLWYVLHKERNMLLTMDDFYQKNAMSFPSPERIAKVDESMENILAVVEERDVAYNLLETGETKKSLSYRRYNSFGFIQNYRPREYLVPWFVNRTWKLKYHYKKLPFWSKFYRSNYRVLLRKERKKIVKRVSYAKKRLLKKFPELGEDPKFVENYLQKKYGYKPPLPYHELVRRPRPDQLPKSISQRIQQRNEEFVNDQF